MVRWLLDRLWYPLQKSAYKWMDDDGGLMAAAVAYYMILSFFPLLMILISAFGFVLRFSAGAQNAQQELLELLAENTSPQLADTVRTLLDQVSTNASIGGPVGLGILLVTASGVFVQFDYAFDRIWNVPQGKKSGIMATIKGLLFGRLRAFLMLLGIGVLMIVAFVAGIALSAVGTYANQLPGGGMLWSVAPTLTSAAIYWALFTIIYKFLPKVTVRWAEAMQGALLTAVLWEISRELLASFLFGERYSAYGVVGSVIALMLWVYIAVSIIFLGAEYVQVICKTGETKKQAN